MFNETILDIYINSPLYRIIDEHALATFSLLATASLIAFSFEATARTAGSWPTASWPCLSAWPGGRSSSAPRCISASCSGTTLEPLSFGYLAAASGMLFASQRVLQRTHWRRWTAGALGASIVAYAGVTIGGNAPDQLALLTKLIELGGLTAALTPNQGARLARLGNVAMVGTALVFSVTSWAGAFGSGDGGHHHGETPPPAVLLPIGEDREATAAEQSAADALHAETVIALAKYSDPAVAAAEGYDVAGLLDSKGFDFHADNPAMKNDGHILDPNYPETLVYAMGPDGPVLLGAMFQMDEIGQRGPAVGGPLTVWHAHDHICMTFMGMSGAVGPFGTCGLGSFAMPVTNEMLHIFIVDGAPDRFGDLDDEWISEALGF